MDELYIVHHSKICKIYIYSKNIHLYIRSRNIDTSHFEMFPETLGILMSGTDQYTHSQLQGSKNKAFPNWHKELCPGCEAGIAELRRKTGSSHLQS